MSSWKVTVAPAVEPITIEEAREQCRVTTSDDDRTIERLISAAREYVESFTRRALIHRTMELRLRHFPRSKSDPIYLPRPPYSSMTTLEYRVPASGSFTPLAEGMDFDVDDASEPAEVHPAYQTTWPTARDVFDGVRATYVAGYGATPETVPDALRQAVALLVANLYENREPTVAATMVRSVPMTVSSLLWPFRLPEVG